MSKRPSFDLRELTSAAATPMAEAVQRVAAKPVPVATPTANINQPPKVKASDEAKTENLKPLAFKVPLTFRRRFKSRAATADLKLNELLFEALDAWEEKRGHKK